MSAVIAATAGGWSYGGSILTFLFPMVLFTFVSGGLFVLLTKPHLVPGHRYHASGRTVIAAPMTTVPSARGDGRHAASGQGTEAK